MVGLTSELRLFAGYSYSILPKVRADYDVWVLFVNIYRQLDSVQITTAKSIKDSSFLGE